MSDEKAKWIEDQKKNKLFRGGGDNTNDANRMLEFGGVNRISSRNQQMKVITARVMARTLDAPCLNTLADLVETAQMVEGGIGRLQFMKVAIEQWQGKISAAKNKITEAIS